MDSNQATREAEHGTLFGLICHDVGAVEPTEPTTGVAEVSRRTRQSASRRTALPDEQSGTDRTQRRTGQSGDGSPHAATLPTNGTAGADPGGLLWTLPTH